VVENKHPTGKFWFTYGYHVHKGPFSFYLRRPEHYYGGVALWYYNGFMTQDDHGYTEGKDIWETEQEAVKVAKVRLEKAIQREKEDHQRKMGNLLEQEKKLETNETC